MTEQEHRHPGNCANDLDSIIEPNEHETESSHQNEENYVRILRRTQTFLSKQENRM